MATGARKLAVRFGVLLVLVSATAAEAQIGSPCTDPMDCTDLTTQCRAGFCDTNTGMCDVEPVNEGTACPDDQGPCVVGATCQAGECTGGGPPDCSGFATECQTFECDPNGDEGNCDTANDVMDGTACDTSACLENETCTGGTCGGGTAPDCAGMNTTCRTFACDPGGAEGNCDDTTDAADNTACTDGDACTLGETCQMGLCTPAQQVDCTVNDTECRLFDCDPNGDEGNCSIIDNATNQGQPCDEGGACVTDEFCDGGECIGTDVDCSGVSTDCVVAECDPMGDEDNCDDLSNEPDGTECGVDDPCLEESGQCDGGMCDAQPLDSDGDGTPDCLDDCPDDPNKVFEGKCGCDVPDEDTDDDGIADCPCPFQDPCSTDDNCAGSAVCVGVGPEGQLGVCSCDDDSDCDAGSCLPAVPGGPGVCVTSFCGDQCPNDENKGAPGICGCLVADADGDGDGVFDCPCPQTPLPCDDDGDCPPDGLCLECGEGGDCGGERVCVFEDGCGDHCPDDGNKVVPGICGCGIADEGDGDGDGVLNCVDACPDDPEKSESAGMCGCGEPDRTYDVGGFVHIPNAFLTGVPGVTVQLFCDDFAYNQIVTTCDEPHPGKFLFEDVPCGLCHLRFAYADSCDDHFDVHVCGQDYAVGASQAVPIWVNEANGDGPAPCLQSVLATAYNGVFDIVGYNEDCRLNGGPCLANLGQPPIVPTLPALAHCLFVPGDVHTCCPAYADFGATFDVDCLCRLDCNNDDIFSIVSDLWCWAACLINGICQPNACPPLPGRVAHGFAGETIGGIIHSDEHDVLMSGIEGLEVIVVDGDGYLYVATTDSLGVWSVEGLRDGESVTVHYPDGRARVAIDVRTHKRQDNQSLKWFAKEAVNGNPARRRGR